VGSGLSFFRPLSFGKRKTPGRKKKERVEGKRSFPLKKETPVRERKTIWNIKNLNIFACSKIFRWISFEHSMKNTILAVQKSHPPHFKENK